MDTYRKKARKQADAAQHKDPPCFWSLLYPAYPVSIKVRLAAVSLWKRQLTALHCGTAEETELSSKRYGFGRSAYLQYNLTVIYSGSSLCTSCLSHNIFVFNPKYQILLSRKWSYRFFKETLNASSNHVTLFCSGFRVPTSALLQDQLNVCLAATSDVHW